MCWIRERQSARGPRFDSWRGVRREVIYLRKAGNRHYINIFEDSPIYKKKNKLHEINTHTHTYAHAHAHIHNLRSYLVLYNLVSLRSMTKD